MSEPSIDATDPSVPPPWWDRWDGRIEWELDCFGRRGLPVELVEDPRTDGTRLVLRSEVVVDGTTVEVVAVFPDSYPHRPFALYAPELQLPRHQAPNGNLCIFPRGSGQWSPKCCAADAIADEVPRLMQLVREGGEALHDNEIPQGEPLSLYFNSAAQGCIVLDDRVAEAFAPTAGDHGEFRVGFTGDPDWMLVPVEDDARPQRTLQMGQGYVLDISRHGTPLLGDPPAGLAARYPNEVQGRWVYLQDPPLTHDPEALWSACVETDPDLAHHARSIGAQFFGVCFPEELQQGVYGVGWTFLVRTVGQHAAPRRGKRGGRSGNPAPVVTRTQTPFQFVRAQRWTDASLSIRIPELAPLRTKTIAFVGLGSLGAPVALELGKQRIGTIRLLDGDYLEPGTSVRHPLGLNYAGVSKSLAVLHAIEQHNPEVRGVGNVFYIGQHALEQGGATEVERRGVLALLQGADLLISATAEHDVNRYLDELASSLGIPRLYLWGVDSYGGIVALLDESTACYHCLTVFESTQALTGSPLVDVPEAESSTIQAPGCADPTFTGNHVDLLPISNHAVRVANGYLCGPEDGYPKFAHSVFAVQTREPDGRPIAPRWTTHDLPPTAGCATCVAG